MLSPAPSPAPRQVAPTQGHPWVSTRGDGAGRCSGMVPQRGSSPQSYIFRSDCKFSGLGGISEGLGGCQGAN